MGICARKNIASRVSKMENMEDEEQDVVWAEVTQSKNKNSTSHVTMENKKQTKEQQ